MIRGNILFPGNPWPRGHGLKDISLGVRLYEAGEYPERPACAVLDLSLKSLDYHAPDNWETSCEKADAQYERLGDELGDWQSMIVWNNYHACTIGTESAHSDLVVGNETNKFDLSKLADFRRHVDPVSSIDTEDDGYFDDRAFSCYILGHDAVAGHDISIKQDQRTHLYNLRWRGKVARAYVGSYEFEHEFKCEADGVPFSGYRAYFDWGDRDQGSIPVNEREDRYRDRASRLVENADELIFKPGEFPYNDCMVLPE